MAGDGDGDGEGETEYESDPEEAMTSLKMRRREASDDEDAERVVEEREGEKRDVSHHLWAEIADSECESDGQGGAAEYGEEEEEEEDYYDEQEEEVAEVEFEEREIGAGDADITGDIGGMKSAEQMIESGEAIGQDQGEEEKKENEPFAVPTSGAFYMHDDRFRGNAGGRHRRTFGGRKLWESKDDRKWGHDKFEVVNIQDRLYEEGRRSSKGYYRGQGKAGGAECGYARVNRMRRYSDKNKQSENHQSPAPKVVKGRGPRRYQPSMKILPQRNKQSSNLVDKISHTRSVRISASKMSPNAEYESVPARQVASNLSSASPPFYPSSSSGKDVTVTQKKETQAGNHSRDIRLSVMDNSFPTPRLNSMRRGKNVIDSVGIDKLNIDDSVSPAGARPLNLHFPSSASSPFSANPMPPCRGEDRSIAMPGCAVFQPPPTNNQVEKASTPPTQALQRNTVQNRGQHSVQPSVHQVVRCPLGVSQGSSPPKTGKGTVQGAGRGSSVCGGAQGRGSGGNVVAGHGDQNLPAFFPVMQFGAQHPHGIGGVPAVGMAFPGYVAQPNGLPNSEMTWLPVLASAAGALGATYCPPYIAVDGSYHPQPTGQTSALPTPSKGNTSSKSDESKPPQRSEVPNHEFSQRQSKPRRYSEMNFSR